MRSFDVLDSYDIVFWDFDGVIKKSNQVKIDAFRKLFKDSKRVDDIIKHHIKNQGVSRFEKIPLYLAMSGYEVTKENINYYQKLFSDSLVDEVIASDWVEGILVTLEKLSSKKKFIVTGTPEDEMNIILQRLEIAHFFENIYGAPKKKTDVICRALKNLKMEKRSIMVGDSTEDLISARNNRIDFMLIKNNFNRHIQDNECDYVYSNFRE